MEKKNFELSAESKAKLIGFGMVAIIAFAWILFRSTGFLFATDYELEVGALDSVMGIVMAIIEKAALYIGIIITLWGVFQIILALRREDSEGISKQITTIVVGAVLVGFGLLADSLYTALTQ